MSVLPFFLFFILVFIGHYFVWRLILVAFPQLMSKRYYLLVLIVLITIGFLGFFTLLNSDANSSLAYFYVFFAVLFGLLSQFMLFGFIFFVRSMIIKNSLWARLHCIFPDPKTMARIFIIIIAGFFILGTYNAFFPRVKRINLSLNNDSISEKRIVHLSDLHLGAIYRPFWLERIVEQVNHLEADYIIISGDLFDGSDRHLAEFIPALSNFEAPTIFVPGNHDSYIFGEEVHNTTEAAGLITLSDEVMTVNDLEIIGFNFLSNGDSNLRRPIEGLSDDKIYPRIVVNHVPVDQAEVEALKADLMLSGHAHRGQIFPFSLATSLLYGKYAYGLEQYKNMISYTSAGTGTWGPPFRTLFPGEIIVFHLKF